MRQINHDGDYEFTQPADTIATLIGSTAGTVIAQDYPTNAKFMHLSCDARVFVHLSSTGVTIPTTTTAPSTTVLSFMHNTGHEHIYYIPTDSTGYSIAFDSSGRATIEFWGV